MVWRGRYVLEGGVGANRMRVNIQLIDAETGSHLWAERFDKSLADLFDMQDEIVARLANALDTQLIAAEVRRSERAPNPGSLDLYFQGLAWLNKGLIPGNVAQARGLFDRALTADPDNVEALVGSAPADALERHKIVVEGKADAPEEERVLIVRAERQIPAVAGKGDGHHGPIGQ
jgi:hypothetical protein